jgi:hypothetical protein
VGGPIAGHAADATWMMLPDLEERLAALEPLRQQTGLLSKGLALARLWLTRMGVAVVASVALPTLAVWLGTKEGADPPTWVFVMAAIGLVAPIAIGLALVVPTTVRALEGHARSDLAYAGRVRADVLEPLAHTAIPGATLDFSGAFDVAQFDASGISRTSVADWERQSPMRVSGALDAMTWTATPVRIWRTHGRHSTTGSKTEVLHDGLFAWTAAPNRLPHTVLVADQASGERSRLRSSPLSALFGRLPDAPVAGDREFDDRFVVLTGDPDALRSLTPDVRRAMLAVYDAVGAPVRIAVSPQGVGLAFPDRGRFRGPNASAQLDERMGTVTPERLLRDMTVAFEADAALLSRVPAALQTLRRALPA